MPVPAETRSSLLIVKLPVFAGAPHGYASPVKSVSNKKQWWPLNREPSEADTSPSLADRYAATGLPRHLLNRLQQQINHIGTRSSPQPH